jgi:Uma2 family endonuclease
VVRPHDIELERFRPLRRAEYDRLVELGVFEGERVELLDGVLVTVSPQGSRHAAVVSRLTRMLVAAVGGRGVVRVQLPFAASDTSEPEPDVVIAPPAEDDYVTGHPSSALLVIEVAESSLAYDRRKAAKYAAAGVPEYWIVDLDANAVEVHSAPDEGAYGNTRVARPGEVLVPAELDGVEVDVGALLR